MDECKPPDAQLGSDSGSKRIEGASGWVRQAIGRGVGVLLVGFRSVHWFLAQASHVPRAGAGTTYDLVALNMVEEIQYRQALGIDAVVNMSEEMQEDLNVDQPALLSYPESLLLIMPISVFSSKQSRFVAFFVKKTTE